MLLGVLFAFVLLVFFYVQEDVPENKDPSFYLPFLPTRTFDWKDDAETYPLFPANYLYASVNSNFDNNPSLDPGTYVNSASKSGTLGNFTMPFAYTVPYVFSLTAANFDLAKFTQKSDKSTVDEVLLDAWGNVDLQYTSAYLFEKLDYINNAYTYYVYYNESFSKQADVPALLNFMNDAIFKTKSSDGKGSLTLYLRNMPTPKTISTFDIVGLLEKFIYPLILHLLFPVFLSNIVYEKEFHLRVIMKMMGLKMKVYWFVNFSFDAVLYAAVTGCFVLCGYLLQFRFFTQNDLSVLVLFLSCWGYMVIVCGFLVSVFFARVSPAIVVGYFVVMIAPISAIVLAQEVAGTGDTEEWVFFLFSAFPSFALYRGIVILSDAAFDKGLGIRLTELLWVPTPSGVDAGKYTDLTLTMIYIVFYATIYFIAFIYLELVWPSDTEAKLPFYFMFLPSFWMRVFGYKSQEVHDEMAENEEEPWDVAAERERVYNDAEIPVRILNLRKEFYSGLPGRRKTKVAVHNLSMGIDDKTCIGMLGPNGAGKTTTMNILSGFFPPTKGEATIRALDVRRHMDAIHTIMGLCPQHDILWDDQTGEEHLQFYARIRNLTAGEVKDAVEQALKQVNLWSARKKLTKQYSGGMKRRLSVAISLIGNPPVIFMDEPTTGLDPFSRRQVWDVILAAKRKRCIFLTTHSMEEADVLCDRLAIFAGGRLHCLGTSAELKSRFGAGFRLSVQTAPDNEEGAIQFVQKLLPDATLINSLAGTRNYEVPTGAVSLSALFKEMEAHKAELGIKDWGIAQTTLEDVFLHVTVNVNCDRVLLSKTDKMSPDYQPGFMAELQHHEKFDDKAAESNSSELTEVVQETSHPNTLNA